MSEYLPILIVGAIIGAFTVAFLLAWAALRKVKDEPEKERNMPDGEIVRRLMQYARPYWKSFVLVFFVMLFSIVYDILSPLIIGRIQGLIRDDFELSKLYAMVGLYAGILVVSLVCTYLQAMILQKTGQKILSQIRMDVFTHIETLSHEQLNNIPVGKLVTRVSNDPNAISYMFTNILVTLAKNSMVIVGVLGAMLIELCADFDGAVLCALCGAVYGDFPEVLPPGAPSGEQCHHGYQYLSVGKSVRYEDYPDFQPGGAEAGRFPEPQPESAEGQDEPDVCLRHFPAHGLHAVHFIQPVSVLLWGKGLYSGHSLLWAGD